jgi:hypothetical protein
MELIIYPLISALCALAVAHYNVLPRWFYKIPMMRKKPFSCVTCLSFWISLITSALLLDYTLYYMLPIMALSAPTIAIQIIKTEQ